MTARGGYREGAGRKAGSLNRRTLEIESKLQGMDCPFDGMRRIAAQAEEKGDLSTAGRMYSELAAYLAPKRKAVELSDKRDSGLEGMSLKELEMLKQQILSGTTGLSRLG